jgi:hypothetical protein
MAEELWLRASGHFVGELLETCAAPGELMSSPELRESSSQMLRVTRGRWPRNDLIPRAARDLKIFPYRRNIGAIVSAVMEKDRQDAQRKKRRAPVRLVDPRREAKLARPSTKAVAPGVVMAPPVAPAVGQRPPSPPHVAETAVARSGGVSTELSVDDYLVGGVAMFDAQTGLPPSGELTCFFVG